MVEHSFIVDGDPTIVTVLRLLGHMPKWHILVDRFSQCSCGWASNTTLWATHAKGVYDRKLIELHEFEEHELKVSQ